MIIKPTLYGSGHTNYVNIRIDADRGLVADNSFTVVDFQQMKRMRKA
jgi:hypothetical protein